MKINGFSPGLGPVAKETTRVIERALRQLSTGKAWRDPKENLVAYRLSESMEATTRGKASQLQALTQSDSLEREKESVLQLQLETTEQMRALAIEASSSTLAEGDRLRIQKELSSLISEFDRLSKSTGLGVDVSSEALTRRVGTGTFSRAATLAAADSILVADVNKDGKADLVEGGGGFVRTRLGRGDGSFGAAKTQSIVGIAVSLVAADLNGDQIEDLIASTESGFEVLIGRGDGSLMNAVTYGSGETYSQVRAGDFDNDGDLDLLRPNAEFGRVELYSNDGQGRFSLSNTWTPAGAFLVDSVDVGDVNGDGILDFVVSYDTSAGNGFRVDVYRGDSSGGFTLSANVFDTFDDTSVVQLEDVDQDGNLDLLFNADVRKVLGNKGAGIFGEIGDLANTLGETEFLDINADGAMDALDLTGAYLFQKNFYGFVAGFAAPWSPVPIDIGDFNSDGVIDVAAAGDGIYLGRSRQRSALADLDFSTAEAASESLRYLDRARDDLLADIQKSSNHINELKLVYDSQSKSLEALSEVQENLESTDLSRATAKLTAAQIRQQAQIAALSQSRISQRTALALLN